MSRSLTSAIKFAFNTGLGSGNPMYTGTASVNVPFRVSSIVVREMFTSPYAQVAQGSIGGTRVALTAPNTMVSLGMTIYGTNVVGTPAVTAIASSVSFTTSTYQAVPQTLLTFRIATGSGTVFGSNLYQLVLATANAALVVGQTISGTGFTTATITIISGTAITLSAAQATGTYASLNASTTATGSIVGNTVVHTGSLSLNIGATVTGNYVTTTPITTVTGFTNGYVYVNQDQAVPLTTLSFTDQTANSSLTECVLVSAIDGMFPAQSVLGTVNIGSDLLIANTMCETHHYFDEPTWLRGLYSVRCSRADGVSTPLDAFTGHLCCVCEFRS